MATDVRNPTSDENVVGAWTGSVGLRYTLVDDYPDTIPNDVIDSPTAAGGAQITFGFSAFSIPAGSTAISVQVQYYDRDVTSGTNNSGSRLKVGGSYFNSATHNPSTTLTARSDNFATNPKTAASWTVDDINGVGANALEAFGFNSTDASPALRYSCVRIQVTYTPPLDGGWSKRSSASGTGTSISLTPTAGDLVVLWINWEASPTSAVTVSDGTNNLTVETLGNNGNNELGQFAWYIAPSGGAKTYTVSPSIGASFSSIIGFVFIPPTGATVTKDQYNVATGTGTSISSGNITTTGSPDSWLVFGGQGNFNANASSNETIDAVADYEVIRDTNNQGSAWYQAFTATFTGDAACSQGSSVAWVAAILAFKATTSSGTTFTQSVDGTLTTAGDIQRQVNKIVAGTVTSAGSLIKGTNKVLGGTATPAGAVLKLTSKNFDGTVSFAGSLSFTRLITVLLDGTLNLAGAITKQTNKIVSGVLTPAANVIKLTSKFFTGAFQPTKALAKQTAKAFAGSLTTAGALSQKIVFTKIIDGTLSFSGQLGKMTLKSLSGTLNMAGALVKQTAKSFSGTLSFSGALVSRTAFVRAYNSTLSFIGNLASVFIPGTPPVGMEPNWLSMWIKSVWRRGGK